MTRFIVALALASGVAVAASAQDTKTTTTVKTDQGDVKKVSYTGCVATGTETRSYVLNKIAPVSTTVTTTDAVGTSGTTTTTSYMLVPGDTIELQAHVGHKVQVEGMMIPAGDSKTTTTTKVERDDAPDSKSKTTVKSDNAMPQFRVTSIKDLPEACTP